MASRHSKQLRKLNQRRQLAAAQPAGEQLLPVGTSRRAKVFARDRYVCRYCGSPATTIDHVVPRAQGGSSALDNLCACCGRCNNLKADLPLQVFLQKLQVVLGKAPNAAARDTEPLP